MKKQKQDDRAIEALLCLALRDTPVTAEEVAEYLKDPPPPLSKEGRKALEKADAGFKKMLQDGKRHL